MKTSLKSKRHTAFHLLPVIPFVLSPISSALFAEENSQGTYNLSGDSESRRVDLEYTGDSARIGVGIDDDFDLMGELLYSFAEDEDSAWIGEAWLNESAGGLKLNYHWLSEPYSEPDNAAEIRTWKLFVAADQNSDNDRKLTLGGGTENKDWFLSGYLSTAFTGMRQTDTDISAIDQLLTGLEGVRAFTQTQTTTTTTEHYEHPYDYGIGARVGHFYDPSLLRVRGGLDYEWGKEDSNQLTFSVGLEKFFSNSGHSLALTAEHFKKSGDFETDDRETRGTLIWRYSFGSNYQPNKIFNKKQVVQEVPAQPAKKEMRLVEEQVNAKVEALFGLDQVILSDDSIRVIGSIAEQIIKGVTLGKIAIVGHSCDLGSDKYNQRLSEKRAEAVKNQLVALGIDENNIQVEGRGGSQPKVPNTSEENRMQNRRVEIQFLHIAEKEVEVPATPATSKLVWVEEEVNNQPAWIRRALFNPIHHKRAVDVYKTRKTTESVSLGERVFSNNAPTIADDVISVPRNSTSISINVLANDQDVDNDVITITSIAQPTNGVAEIVSEMITYTPATGFAGVDSFTYTVADEKGEAVTANVTVTVVNSAPVSRSDTATTNANQAVFIDALGNDSDADNDTLTLVSAGSAENGSVTIENGMVQYTPHIGFFGTDHFTYEVSDGVDTIVSEVSVAVAPLAPTVGADDVNTEFETAAMIDVLANDNAFSGSALTVTNVSTASHGEVSLIDGVIQYTPEAGFSGVDTFTYTVEEATGLTSSATVTVTVANDSTPNNAPSSRSDSFQTNLTDTVVLDVLANDTDADGDLLTITHISQLPSSSMAIITINPDNTLTFQPQSQWRGAVLTFTYTVSDGKGGTSTGTVRVKC